MAPPKHLLPALFHILCALSLGTLAAATARGNSPIKRTTDVNTRGSVVNLVMGNGNLNVLQRTNARQVIGNLSMIQPKPSAIVPLLYNTNLSDANPHLNKEFITVMKWLQKEDIPFWLGVGLAPVSENGQLNTTMFAEIVSEYAKWTDRIQISAANTIFYPADPVGFVATMNWLNQSLGFKHIQLNGWPRVSQRGGLVNFNNPAIDSVFYEVANTTFDVHLDYLPHFFALRSDMNVMTNYENPTQQVTLARMSQDNQIAAFTNTIDSISNSTYGQNGTLKWTVPWSRNYSPMHQGTWPFILQQLSALGG